MNCILITLMLSIAFSLFLLSEHQKAFSYRESGKDQQAKQVLRQLENEFLNACVKADTKALDPIWVDEYSFAVPDGTVLNKENYLAPLQSVVSNIRL